MTDEIRQLIEKGVRSLESARVLFQHGDYDFAVSRAYYSMFYLAEAALLRRGLTFKSHRAVISAFWRELVKPGDLPQRLHEALYKARAEREISDYQTTSSYPRERGEEVLAHAQEFVTTIRAFLEAEEAGGQDVGGHE